MPANLTAAQSNRVCNAICTNSQSFLVTVPPNCSLWSVDHGTRTREICQKTVADFIFNKILLDGTTVIIYLSKHERLSHVAFDTRNAQQALRQCLPDQLKDETFKAILDEDKSSRHWLRSLMNNLGRYVLILYNDFRYSLSSRGSRVTDLFEHMICMLFLFFCCLLLHAEHAAIDDGGWHTEKSDVVGHDGPCNIERHDAQELTQKEFLRRFAYSEPVIIYNINNEEFRERTTKQRMLEDWKDSPEPTTFGDYIENRLGPQNPDILGNETMYMFGTGVPFHFHGPGFAEVIYGSKRWFLYPYEERPDFEPDRTTLEWYLNDYPSLPREKRPLECLMKPGEIIYFPDKWWHATLNTETSVFISTFLSP
ncbi:hypothetical protein COOONC_09633 [Cooperia oncophora]